MKIIITMQIPYVPALGGANKCNRLLAEALVEQSHEVQVIVPATNEANAGTLAQVREQLAAQAIQVRTEPGVDLFHLKGVEVHALHESAHVRAHLIRQIKAFEPDWILISSEEWSQGLLNAALKAMPSRVVYLAHSATFLPFGPTAFFPSQDRTRHLEQVAGILACSHFVKDYIQKWSGLESTVFHFPAYGPGPFHNFGCFDTGFVTLINPSAVKGISIYLELARKFPDVQFACVPTWGTTQNDRVELERLPNITCLEPREDIDQIFAQTKILVLPSLWPEGFPLTSVEAMLRGIPVLASNAGGLPEAKLGTDFVLPVTPIEEFTENLDDRLIPIPIIPEQTEDDIDQWCHALESLLFDRIVYEKQSRMARGKALDFVSNLSIAPLEDFLANLASQRKRSRLPMKSQGLSSVKEEKNELSNTLAHLTPEQQALLSQWLQTPRTDQPDIKTQSPSFLIEDSDASSSVSALQQHPPLSDPPVLIDPKWSEGNERTLRMASSTNEPPIVPISRKNSLPLSFAQQRLWFLDQWEPDNVAYLLPCAWRLKGSLDIDALEASLTALEARHESLRTTFSLRDEQPVQVIGPVLPFSLPYHDLTTLPEPAREAELQRRIHAEVRQAFDLTTRPLWRGQLLRLGSAEHVLLLTLHHIITDGWSMGVLWKDLAKCYGARVAGTPADLPPLPIQYVDFAVWQREWLQGECMAHHVTYWQEQLQGAPATLTLPTDYPRPPVQSFRGAQQSVVVPAALTQQLKALSLQNGVTLFMTGLAAFQVLLARYTGERDIVVGSPIANRTHQEIEGLIGFFANTVVLRTRLTDTLSFRELLHQVRATCLEAYHHQDLPFEKLVEVLQPERDPGRNPLFQVMFQLYTPHDPGETIPNLTVSQKFLDNGTAKFDLLFSLEDRDNDLYGGIEYATDLFEEATVTRLIGHYQRLLEEIIADPTRRIDQLPFLPAAEETQVLVEWNATQRTFPKELCVHELVEEQVRCTPDSIAVVFGEQSVTYSYLNHHAHTLARHLQDFGVGPDIPVGVCVERSVDMVVTVLAVLKAGGTYVPLDPTYPQSRLNFMLKNSEVAVLVTQRQFHDLFAESMAHHVWVDEDLPLVMNAGKHSVSIPVTPTNLAYVMYTSGSTGQPKGVAMPHHALVNLVTWQAQQTTVPRDARTLQFTSLNFDVSAQEIFTTLGTGGTLILVSEEQRQEPVDLMKVLMTARVERLFVPVVALHQLAEVAEAWELFPTGIQEIMTAGEALQITPVLRRFLARLPQCTLHNHYGPTETHVCTALTLDGPSKGWPARPPIGRPIANEEAYVLDKFLQPVPIGVAGELYVGGVGIARGYVNRIDLTAERFLPNPFSADTGKRFYKTGDVARYLPDGSIDYLCRTDHQVKLRGYRIELGEIEQVLTQHSAVESAVVLLRENISGENQLVAYVVSRAPVSELGPYLRGRIPGYMVPGAFVVLEQLPLTPNGKIDRKALPAPNAADRTQGRTYVAPRTPLEEMLVGIWQDVLKLTQVGIHDNFFELGGHSLLATRVVSRMRTAMHTDVSVRTLFDSPTIAQLANSLEALRSQNEEAQTPPLRPQKHDGPISLSFAQQRLWFLDQLEPGSSAYLMSSPFHLRGALQLPALEASLQILVQRHETLRTTFRVEQNLPVQIIAPEVTVSLSILDLQQTAAAEQGQEVDRLLQEEAHHPFDLTIGPLFRFRVLKLGAEDHIFLVTLHHIISDGWSMGVFFQELSTVYSAVEAEHAPSLPPLPIQYADYAMWQREWLQGQQLDSQVAYWREQLQPLVLALSLPTDYPRPALQTVRGAKVPFTLPASVTEGLKVVSQRAQGTLFMTLLAAFQILLQRLAGQDDVCVGIPSAGRTRREIEPLIGFFINTLVIRSNLANKPTFGELLTQVRRTCLEAYAHQDVPFEKLVEVLQPARDLSRPPFFQVFFNMIPGETTPFTLPDLTVTSISNETPDSKFDLTVYLQEDKDQLNGTVVYNATLFRTERMKALVAQYQQLLENIVASPEQVIERYSLVSDESRQVLPDPTVPLKSSWAEETLITKLAQHAQCQPTQIAIQDATGTCSYERLQARSNQVAQFLRAKGIQSQEVVAVFAHRDASFVCALLGILKAGAAFLILDPAYPQARLQQMLELAQPKGLISLETAGALPPFLKTFAASLACHCLLPPLTGPSLKDHDELGEFSTEELSLEIDPDAVAYLLFTSGTSGIPQCVQSTHRPLAHFLAWYTHEFHCTATDRFTMFSGLAHDPVLRDIFAPLWVGGTLCIPNPDDYASGQVVPWMRDHTITVTHLTPAYLEMVVLATEPIKRTCPSLRHVVCGGDRLLSSHVEHIRRLAPHARCVNSYGATETPQIMSYFVVPTDETSFDGSLPVGKGIEGVQLLVLNQIDQLAGIGELGEICIRTPYLARGYFQNRSLTEAKFQTNPFGHEAEDRWYRTGDLGRYRPDGTVQVDGRMDSQVKLRGYRIELGEIEVALRDHPSVSETVVVCREDRPGEKQLVAYIVGWAAVNELRSYLLSRLPGYMVPAAFVVLEHLPLTPNAKIDRKALPTPEAADHASEIVYVAPHTVLEELVVEVWQEVLNIERIGIHDNFFELGGHSLLATQVIARLRHGLELAVPLRTLFEHPTVAELAIEMTVLLDSTFPG